MGAVLLLCAASACGPACSPSLCLCRVLSLVSPQFDKEAIAAFAKFKEELKRKDSSAGGTPPASSALSSALAVRTVNWGWC